MPLIGLELCTQAQCALASRKQRGIDRVAAKNIAKYSDYVVIISVNISMNIFDSEHVGSRMHQE